MLTLNKKVLLYINPKYSDRQARANSVDPDQTPQTTVSCQGFPCILNELSGNPKMLLKFQGKYS